MVKKKSEYDRSCQASEEIAGEINAACDTAVLGGGLADEAGCRGLREEGADAH